VTDPAHVGRVLTDAHRREWPLVVAATVRVARDLDLAEEAAQEAFADAVERWTRDGVPANPGAWLIVAARRRAVDMIRRESTLRSKLPLLIEPGIDDGIDAADEPEVREAAVRDDLLRLILMCCHPALEQEAQSALTLRLVCGVSTPDIAALFLVPEPTMAARITRAKRKIGGSGIPFRIPADGLPERMERVLDVVHLLFTAGHTGPSGEELLRPALLDSAVRLAVLVHEALPEHAEAAGLLALLLATDARRGTRTDADGRLLRLDEQDRTRWDRPAIERARGVVMAALPRPDAGRFCLQAAIAVLHAEPERIEDTDEVQILALYDRLLEVWPTPVVRLNRAIALGRVHGPSAELEELESLRQDERLDGHHLFHAAVADALERSGRAGDAGREWGRAVAAARNGAEAAYLRQRLDAVRPP
jgi:RNA polymerase sigma factor (sigma-70 family)